MKPSSMFKFLSYMWLVSAVVNLLRFMSAPNLGAGAFPGGFCLLGLAMFYLNVCRQEFHEAQEALESKNEKS